jgi:hypothetical protein
VTRDVIANSIIHAPKPWFVHTRTTRQPRCPAPVELIDIFPCGSGFIVAMDVCFISIACKVGRDGEFDKLMSGELEELGGGE